MFGPICILGRHFAAGDLARLQEWIDERPERSRRALSVELARLWGWRNGCGHLRDMATRLVLNRLEQRVGLRLPPRQRRGGRRQVSRWLGPELGAGEPITEGLDQLQPLCVRVGAPAAPERARAAEYLRAHHYLGYPQRTAHLGQVSANSRFLILPWVRARHLASHVLALVLGRLPQDWEVQCGQRAVLVESFVEVERFAGTCYRASNWLELGLTQGRSRAGQPGVRVPVKRLYLRPLRADFRAALCR